MNEIYEEFRKEALRKLADGVKAQLGNRHAEAMKRAVHDALADFCRQDGEFAQAVAQGGSFADCMNAVAKNVGSSISDVDAYRRAVQFYFPGADIRVQMTVDLCASVTDAPADDGKIVKLDLLSLL